MKGPLIYVLDNQDSFTQNLVHLSRHLSRNVFCQRNDAVDWALVCESTHIIIGPGPGMPEDSSAAIEILERVGSEVAILGVCLGMQAMVQKAGGQMHNLDRVQHGMCDTVQLTSEARLLPDHIRTFEAGRYHSWAFTPENVPLEYKVTATGSDGCVMAVEHRSLPRWGVQFHPESVMTQHGHVMLKRWFQLCGGFTDSSSLASIENNNSREATS